jgi:hypothetical protein
VTGISATSPAAVCIGSPLTLLATATSGTIDWYSFDAGGPSLFTGTSYSPTALSASKLYYVATSGCASALRVPVQASIYPNSAGGNVSGSTTVAPGSNNTMLTLNANTGSVLKWQSSTDAFNAVVNDITNSTAFLNVSNVNQNTQYRALVQSGNCPVVFSTSASISVFVTLAINNKSIKVSSERNGALIQWSASSASGVDYYEVEKSANAVSFVTAGKLSPAASQQPMIIYKWFDANPLEGNSYYRVKETGKDGRVSYSDVVKFSFDKTNPSVISYPNPVTGLSFHLQFNEANAGSYQVRILNASGQLIMQKKVQPGGSNHIETVNLPSDLTPGTYKVAVVGSRRQVFQIIVL